IVVRMLRNLEGIYARRGDWTKALAVIDRLLVVDADAPTHRRDRGTVLVKLGELHRGASEWERYLTRCPQARCAAAFREGLRRGGGGRRLAKKNWPTPGCEPPAASLSSRCSPPLRSRPSPPARRPSNPRRPSKSCEPRPDARRRSSTPGPSSTPIHFSTPT